MLVMQLMSPCKPTFNMYVYIIISAILTKGNNFWDLLFAFSDDKVYPEWDQLLKDRIWH